MAIFKGQIAAPAKSSGPAMFLLLGLIVVLGLAETNALPQGALLFCPLVLLILPLTIASRNLYSVHFNIFLLFTFLLGLFPHFPTYPFCQLTALLLYAYTVMTIPSLRQSAGWVRMGRFNGTIWALVLAAIVISCTSLIVWVKAVSPDLSHYSGLIPQGSLWVVVTYGIGYCAFNAAVEEITWRGLMMQALDSVFGAGFLSIVIQAASFAVAHYQYGFPNGITGGLMVFVCGLMLGVIRRKSKGMAACWLAHVAADFTIYCLVFYFVSRAVK